MLVGVLGAVIGVGLAVAPAAFNMFHRAPLGGQMINDFRPFMTSSQVALFRGYLADIDAANTESIALGDFTQFPSLADLNERWPSIDADMTDLIDRMDRNLDNFAAVDALPPFPLFPWFFVVPGALIAGTSLTIARSARRGQSARKRTWALAALGLGVVLAPVAFQMFTRAPKGREMIDDFRPMMTAERVRDVQLYFITLGAAEGELRTKVVPLALAADGSATYPAIAHWSAEWPGIVRDFNPMIATMTDSLDNYAAVDALPPFNLFPWFFVIPGALVAGLSFSALKFSSTQATESQGALPT